MTSAANLTTLTRSDAEVSAPVRACFGPFLGPDGARRLTLGATEEPGFVRRAPTARELSTVARGSIACVLALHVCQYIDPLLPFFAALRRVLAADGTVCLVTPYASSDEAWEDPAVVRAFTERTWTHLPGFVVAKVTLIPYPDLQLGADGLVGRQAELQVKKRFMRNVIKEMHVVLRRRED